MGVIVRTKWQWMIRYFGILLAAGVLPLLNGCGSSTNANVITISLNPSAQQVFVGTTLTVTATEGGVTTQAVTWTCMFTTEASTATKATSPAACSTANGMVGSISDPQATTVVYNAPATVPDPTTFPSLIIMIIATATADTKITATSTIALSSGIAVSFTPDTATVPTKEQQPFILSITNDTKGEGVTWLLTQTATTSTNPATAVPNLPSCSPVCGTISDLGVYTAPATVPTSTTVPTTVTSTPTIVTVVATPKADTSVFTTGTITIVQGGPITFNSISPNFAPQGAQLWDIYLDAPNISTSSVITVTDPNGGQKVFNAVNNAQQVKILFPIPNATVTAPASTGARLRLSSSPLNNVNGSNATPPDLVLTGTYTVTVIDTAEGVTTPNLPANPADYQFTVLPVRATSVSTAPDGFNLGALTASGLQSQSAVRADGGYFGPGGQFVDLSFAGNQASVVGDQSSDRQLTVSFNNSVLESISPGLYPLSVGRSQPPLPARNNASVTNLSIFPDYSVNQPLWLTNSQQPPATPFTIPPVVAGKNPSAIDIDPVLGVVVVAETGDPVNFPGSSAVQFYRIASQANPANGSLYDSLIPIDYVSGQDCTPSSGSTTCPVTGVGAVSMNLPTGLSVNRTNHTVAVVNYGSQTVSQSGVPTITGQTVMDLPIPVPGAAQQNPAITPFAIDISNILQKSVVPAPMPYAIGVDPDTNFAIVAYSSTSTSAPANLGFILNLNSTTPANIAKPCNDAIDIALIPSIAAGAKGQCVFAQVTLNTGQYPQIAMAPHGHLALITPGGGGGGQVQGVDLTQTSNSAGISAIMIADGVVTVATSGVADLIFGDGGSVLITGVDGPNSGANTTPVNFNGVYSVTVNSASGTGATGTTTFSYSVSNTTASATFNPTKTASNTPTVFFGSPNLSFAGFANSQGIAINPITRTAALANANATGTGGSAQINLLANLDQSQSSIFFLQGCTAFSNPCPNAAELPPGTTSVAWQPFTNTLVSYNPALGQVSISDPVQSRRYAIVPMQLPNTPQPQQMRLGPSDVSLTVANDSTNTLTLFGGVAVDPATNNAFVVESGAAGSMGPPAVAAIPGRIDIISLDPYNANITPPAIKAVHVSEILVPSPIPGPGIIGGITNASVPQGTLTCVPVPPAQPSSCDLVGVQIFGGGFVNNISQVLLDGTAISGSVHAVNSRQIIATIPSTFLSAPHKYALQISTNGVASNAVDFLVIQAVDLSKVCVAANGATNPSSVAVADQIAHGPFSPIAVVTMGGCNNIAIVDINPANKTYGSVINTVPVGSNPEGVAISQRFGLAVVANNGDGTASILDLTKNPPTSAVPAVQTGSNAQPMGVAINDATGAALVANFNANTVSEIDLSLLSPPVTTPPTAPPATLTALTLSGIQAPIAVAIDPDRGPTNQGIAVVTALQFINGGSPIGALAVVDIGLETPALSTTISASNISATPTGIVFDPAFVTGTANNGVFYASSSGGNLISVFNPDAGQIGSVSVGINPTSLALNPETGALLTTNLGSQTSSIVDVLANPLRTLQTIGIPGSAQFGVAIDQFTNTAVIVDQANNRLLLFEMPN